MGLFERSYQQVVREAELLSSSPEQIAAELREAADQAKTSPFEAALDEDTERALLELKNARVDIALARYCHQQDTARSLFFREPNDPAIRMAVLSNQTFGGKAFKLDPLLLFKDDKRALSDFLASASRQELSALFNNPTLDDFFISDLLQGNEHWSALGEGKQVFVLLALSNNPRIKEEYDSRHMDGWAEYKHESVFNAAWGLAATAPVRNDWAMALSRLYEHLLPAAHSIDDPLAVAARWQSPEGDKAGPGDTYLSNFAGVRKALALLAIQRTRSQGKSLLEHEDVAFRAAAYSVTDMTPEQLAMAYDRDGELAFNYLVHNDRLWRQAATREALHDIAWQVVDNDSSADLMAANIYNFVEESFRSKCPDWFKQDEEQGGESLLDPSAMPATKADVAAVTEALGESLRVIEQVKSVVATVNARVGFVWWFSLGALVGSWLGAR